METDSRTPPSGVPPQKFGPSPGKLVVALAANGFLWWAWLDDYLHLRHNRQEVALEFAVALLALGVLAWLASLQLVLSDDAVRYRSLFRFQSLRWNEIELIYSSRGQRTAFFVVPLWRHCRYVLVSRTGERMVFGSRFRNGCFAGEKAILMTAAQLYKRAAERFNRGGEVPFGPIRVSKQGVRTEGWKAGLYPWAEIEKVDETAGGLFLQLTGGRTAGGRGTAHIPNLNILMQILLIALARRSGGESMDSLPMFESARAAEKREG